MAGFGSGEPGASSYRFDPRVGNTPILPLTAKPVQRPDHRAGYRNRI